MRKTLLAATLVASALAVDGTAGGAILPQKGIAGVNIGMSQGKVRSVLGAPVSVRHGKNDFGKFTMFRYAGLHVIFQGNSAVTDVSTTRKSERTGSGAGVGSTEAQVKAKVAGVKCKIENGFHHCFVGRFLPGKRVTDFLFKNGRVTRVDVGVVID
jgi:hypothetical protein